MTNLIGIDELCKSLSIGRTTAYTLLRKKKIPGIKIGNTWKIKLENVDKFISKLEENEK